MKNMFFIFFGFILLISRKIYCEKSPYFSTESLELDSSEHGGPMGSKGTTCNCGWSNKDNKRVVGGKETGVNEYPFVAALVDEMESQFCGGTIITPYQVITAAHCTDKFLRTRNHIRVLVGEHNLISNDETKYTQIVPVKKILQHEYYNDDTIQNDISLLLLSREIRFNQYVGPVCLSTIRMNLENMYVKVIGWGRTQDDGIGSEVLKEANLRVVSLKTCEKIYESYVNHLKRKQICTHGNQKGSCRGDSGGPLVWLDPETNRYTLVGIVSFGAVCGSLDPSVYTDPTAYINWIQQKLEESSPAGIVPQICSKK